MLPSHVGMAEPTVLPVLELDRRDGNPNLGSPSRQELNPKVVKQIVRPTYQLLQLATKILRRPVPKGFAATIGHACVKLTGTTSNMGKGSDGHVRLSARTQGDE